MQRRIRTTQRGVTLIETMVAVGVLLVAAVGTMSLFAIATGHNKNQGEMSERTIDLCQDKIEQLLALGFNNATANTTVFPVQASGGTGLGGVMAGNATAGGVDPAAPVTGYVDYLSAGGTLLTGPTGAAFTRVWSISTNAGGNLKTVRVVTVARTTSGGGGLPPVSRLTCFKTDNQ